MSNITVVTAITAITLIAALSLIFNQNGSILDAAIAAISGLAGYSLGIKHAAKSKPKP